MTPHCQAAMTALMLLLCLPGAADWPGFQGPDRSGVAPEADIRTDWGGAGPTVSWVVETAPGFGGVAIAQDSVYILDRNGIAGDRLRAINLQTGEQRWAIDYDAPGRLSYDGARSTPTLATDDAGSRAYTVGPLGHITCFDLDNAEILWQKHMSDFNAEPPKWGWSQSPLLLGELIVIQPMAEEAGLVALDQKTGDVAWTSANIGREGYSSPRLVQLAQTPQIVTYTSTQVTGLAPNNGTILWSYDNIPVRRAIPTPTPVGPDKLFITAGYDAGSALIRVRKNNDAFTVEELRRDQQHGGQVHSALPVGQHLYVNLNTNENLRQRGKDAHGLGCFDADGNLLWKNDNTPGIDRGPVLAIGEYLLTLGGEDGVLRLIRADPAGYDELASFQAFDADQRRNMIWAPMAFAHGRLILRSQNQLKCLDLRPAPQQ
ncbi:MAG: PQQ-binding-like beta-propeller repeat protein [Planctomycetota bacterium]